MSCLIPYNPHLFPVFLFTSPFYIFIINTVFASYGCFNLLGYPGWIIFIDSYDSIWNIFNYNVENYLVNLSTTKFSSRLPNSRYQSMFMKDSRMGKTSATL